MPAATKERPVNTMPVAIRAIGDIGFPVNRSNVGYLSSTNEWICGV